MSHEGEARQWEPAPREASVTFKDVAAYFSAEEWEVLEEWQKALYRKVMKEIHAALLSLGYRIVNPDTVFWVKKEAALNSKWNQDLGEIQNINVSYANLATPCPDILVRIKTDDEAPLSDPADLEEGVAGETRSATYPVADAAVSLQIKEEEGPCARDPPHVAGMDCAYNPSTGLPVIASFCSLNFKEERPSKDSERGDGIGNPAICSSGFQPDQFLQRKPEDEEHVGADPGALGSASCPATEDGHAEGRLNGRSPEDCQRRLETAFGKKARRCSDGEDVFSVQCSAEWHPRDCPRKRLTQPQRHEIRNPVVAILPQGICTGERPCTSIEYEKKLVDNLTLLTHRSLHMGKREDPTTEYEDGSVKSENYRADMALYSKLPPFSFYGKYFPRAHWKAHRGGMLHQCPACEKSFSRKSNLVMHQRTHTGEKPYRCAQCGKNFSQKSGLNRHRRTHTGERPYECTECTRSFHQNTGLQSHRRTHTGERPYTCAECGKRFPRKDNLVRHQRIHSIHLFRKCGKKLT